MTLKKGETENYRSNSGELNSDGTVDLSQDWLRNYLNFLQSAIAFLDVCTSTSMLG